MSNSAFIKSFIHSDEGKAALYSLYPSGVTGSVIQRICNLVDAFVLLYGENENMSLFSTPGRTEIGGNHTDHNHGRVLAASVDLDTIAVAAPNSKNIINLKSEGYSQNFVDLNDLEANENEYGDSNALIRGVCASFIDKGINVGGFDAVTTTDVLSGSGLSSSAAFEVLLCTIVDNIYGSGNMHPIEKAKISQFSENIYFGKPCGLMDQSACAYGGLIALDFFKPDEPSVEEISFNLADFGHHLCITDTGGTHANLTGNYAAIPAEMKAVANELGASHLSETSFTDFWKSIPSIRKKTGDRALLRAMHFYGDDQRVLREMDALKSGNFDAFLREIRDSGNSSFMYLQNIFDTNNISTQNIALALCMSDFILKDRGAFRVHGGGFAGTIQAFVPDDLLNKYKSEMEAVFGADSCHVLSFRPVGSVKII